MRCNRQLLFVAVVSACVDASELDDAREVDVIARALSPCSEVVPADRNVDGIPAYEQCEAVAEEPIFSNNGVDTSTTKLGPDWVRTQYGGGYQCTELAGRYMHFKWDVKWRPNGNAGMWCDAMPPSSSGLVQTMDPVHGDIMVLAPNSCGAAPDTGHVTVVDLVDPSGRLTVVEQNGARRGTYKLSCAKCFLHAVANDGTNPGNQIGEATTAQPAAAGSAAPRPTAWRPPASGDASQGRAQGGARAPASSASEPSSSAPSQSPPPAAPSIPALAGSAAPAPSAVSGAPSLVSPPLPSGRSNSDSASALGAEVADNTRQTDAAGCSVPAVGQRSSSGLQAAFAVAGVLVAAGVRRRRSGRGATPTR